MHGVRQMFEVVAALNDEPTRLLGTKPVEAIEAAKVARLAVGLYSWARSSRPVLYAPGELKGGRRRATHPN